MSLDQVFPPKPTFTENELSDQTGKVFTPSLSPPPSRQPIPSTILTLTNLQVFLITGAAAGVGIELAKILYSKHGTVYIATRSLPKITLAKETIRTAHPSRKGRLEHILLDLSDLSTIRPAAEEFLAKENRLDVLFHNAAVMNTPREATSRQGHELQMATNALGPHLLTTCLEDVLGRTAEREKGSGREGGVRVVWLSSFLAGIPKGGVVFDGEGRPTVLKQTRMNYMQTKVGNIYLCHEWMVRMRDTGVVNVVVHPGFIKTELQRNNPWLGTFMVCYPLFCFGGWWD